MLVKALLTDNWKTEKEMEEYDYDVCKEAGLLRLGDKWNWLSIVSNEGF
jgi:hypothetical protein